MLLCFSIMYIFRTDSVKCLHISLPSKQNTKSSRNKFLFVYFMHQKGSSMVATKRWCIKRISMATVGTATKYPAQQTSLHDNDKFKEGLKYWRNIIILNNKYTGIVDITFTFTLKIISMIKRQFPSPRETKMGETNKHLVTLSTIMTRQGQRVKVSWRNRHGCYGDKSSFL